MGRLTDSEVDRIARILAGRLGSDAAGDGVQISEKGTKDSHDRPPDLSHGLFPDVDSAVEAATAAYHQLGKKTLALRKEMISSIRAVMLKESESLARLAHEETGLGRFPDKIKKNLLVTRKTPGTEVLTPLSVTGDRGLTLREPAPYGVIGAITPVTNPSSTLICNAIGMVAAGNSVVFNVHPGAKHVGRKTVQLLNQAIVQVGGPPNLVTAVAEPTIKSAQAVMHHSGIRLLVVTGGPGVVKAAMQSGKRAICAGPGNPPVVVDETADIEAAGRDIVLGASFDNNVICVDEKEVFVVEKVADALLDSMARQGACVLSPAETRRLEREIFTGTITPGEHATVKKELIGQNAVDILSRIGVTVDPSIRLAVADVSALHPLVWTEQMMPVLPVVRVEDADKAIDMAKKAEHGNGHTAAMYSKNLDNLSRMAREMSCSIFIKNGPCYAGLGEGGEGYSSFTIASPTGEGLTDPRSFSRIRRCVLIDHFRIV